MARASVILVDGDGRSAISKGAVTGRWLQQLASTLAEHSFLSYRAQASVVRLGKTCLLQSSLMFGFCFFFFFFLSLFFKWKEAKPDELMDSKLRCVFEMPNENDKLVSKKPSGSWLSASYFGQRVASLSNEI